MEQNIIDFLNSDLVESDFYNLPKEDLISLKDYLLKYKALDTEFLNLIKEPLCEMKEKCPWINDLAFNTLQLESTGEYFNSSIWLFPIEGHNLIICEDKEDGIYKGITKGFPKIYLLNRNIRKLVKRQNEIMSIQEELREIDNIGRNFYDGLLYGKKSISDNFNITYIPNIGMDVWIDSGLLADFLVRKMKEYNKPYLKETEKNKILTKIQIRQ